MIRKPMLMKNIMGAKVHRGREVIGLIGTHHGTGVTHTGIMLAFYMGIEKGKKTALLECNKHHDMIALKEAYDWSADNEECFSFRRITCFPEVSQGRMSGIFNEDYDCIIMDFGTDLMGNREEFLRCTAKLVIGGKAEWEIPRLRRFYDTVRKIRGSDDWQYFIPRASNKAITRIEVEAGLRAWSVPVNDEPVLPSQLANHFFGRFF